MPIRKIVKNGKTGFRFGKHGKVYLGIGARKKSIKQAAAISISKKSSLNKNKNKSKKKK